jgi:hypothetical protein
LVWLLIEDVREKQLAERLVEFCTLQCHFDGKRL